MPKRAKRQYSFINRQPAGKRQKKKLSLERLENIYTNCCAQVKTECETLAVFDPKKVITSRKKTELLTKQERALKIHTATAVAIDHTGVGQAVHYVVSGHKLCINAFATLYNTSAKTIRKYSSMAALKDTEYAQRICPATGPLVDWLRCRLPGICDISPLNGNFHLPPGTLTKKELRELFLLERRNVDTNLASKPTFYKVLKVHFEDLKFPKESRHGKCDDCEKIATLLTRDLSEEDMALAMSYCNTHKTIWM